MILIFHHIILLQLYRHDPEAAAADEFLKKFKIYLMKKFQWLNEIIINQGNQTLLNEIYTELYITEGDSGEINEENEVRQIESASRRITSQETPIKCNDIFKLLSEEDKPIKTVLMKGIAGIGKTVSVQKFILDWAEGKENQDIHLIIPLPFRELNLMKDQKLNLMELLHVFLKETKEMKISSWKKVLFIFDGLDECRFPLDFQNTVRVCDVSESASVPELLINLIKGNLLPSALLWITSRPAAADQIPSECVHRVTEVRGFNDPQKEEYFRKRISDQILANNIITHLKSLRSLYIMCHIPVFCWISATVLERMLGEAESGEIPKTLTQMYTHFLIIQTKIIREKFSKKQKSDEEIILKLGQLAFQQLMKGNLIFYEEDLRECGIDVTEAAVYSDFQNTVRVCDVSESASVPELLINLIKGNLLPSALLWITSRPAAADQIPSECVHRVTEVRGFNDPQKEEYFRKRISDQILANNIITHLKALRSLYIMCHIPVFCWISATVLERMLGEAESGEIPKTLTQMYTHFLIIQTKIIREKFPKKQKSDEEIILKLGKLAFQQLMKGNLIFYEEDLRECGIDVTEAAVYSVEEIQRYLKSGKQSELSSTQWSALVFVLLTSAQNLEEFDQSKYISMDKIKEAVLLKMMPVIAASKKAIISCDEIRVRSWSALVSVFSPETTNLRELHLTVNTLNLSGKILKDSDVECLSALLGNPHSKVGGLRLHGCDVSNESLAVLTSALRTNPSHLRELNLSQNNVGDSGVTCISSVLENPRCKLGTLRLCNCGVSVEGCAALTSALSSNLSLRELDLSNNTIGDSGVKVLSALLENPHSCLAKLRLGKCGVTDGGCAALSSALRSNPSHLRELSLSWNHVGDPGLTCLSAVLENPCCKLEKLWLQECGVSDEGCAALTSALRSNPFHLTELDLSNNHVGDSGVKGLSSVLENPHCKLAKLRLCICGVSDKGCTALTSALRLNPSHLRELNLSCNKIGVSGVKGLSALLKSPLCNLETLWLRGCGVSDVGCAALTSALRSNPSQLRDLNLSDNKVGDSGKEMFNALKEEEHYKLQKLM
ncbi:NACHT, LRR and PYD domains-containing protein 12 isoform X1 [Silurus asotus]|uniref:NACHT, LRR and PYD domains-containing protein 12 isoform X1 n=1 Tax=Silurus asotus TaxID=30991 RepID=A0AAD5AJI8_SILAS|nr:NACHT, LRR and PYD domains-containing protein 12 isoform X1 [Silurus asotus]